jgi:AAA domain
MECLDLKAARYSLVPSCLQSERVLLGCLLADADCQVNLETQHFLDRDHQRLFAQIQLMKIVGQPRSFPNLLARLVREKISVKRYDLNHIQAQADVLPILGARENLSIPNIARGCARRIEETFRQRQFSLPGEDVSRLEPSQLPGPLKVPIPFQRFCDFNRESFFEDQRWLVPGVLLAGQPGVISGPVGSLQTAIALDLLISVDTGRDFLGRFPVAETGRTLFMTHESLRPAIQDLARRICAARGIDPNSLQGFCVCTEWPDMSNINHLSRLRDIIASQKFKVVAIDPACLPLFERNGPLPKNWTGNNDKNRRLPKDSHDKDSGLISNPLEALAHLSRSTGCSVLFVHRSTGSRQAIGCSPLMPNAQCLMPTSKCLMPNLANYAHQWIQLSHRARFDPQTGNHELWMSCGTLDRADGTWAVDVREGETNKPGRHWQVDVLPPDAARERLAEQNQRDADQRRERRAKAPLERDRKRMIKRLEDARDGLTATALRNLLGCNGDWAKHVLQSLMASGDVEISDDATGHGGAALHRLVKKRDAETRGRGDAAREKEAEAAILSTPEDGPACREPAESEEGPSIDLSVITDREQLGEEFPTSTVTEEQGSVAKDQWPAAELEADGDGAGESATVDLRHSGASDVRTADAGLRQAQTVSLPIGTRGHGDAGKDEGLADCLLSTLSCPPISAADAAAGRDGTVANTADGEPGPASVNSS